MILLSDGRYGTSRNEQITIRIVAKNTQNLTGIADNASCGAPVTINRGPTTTASFQMPQNEDDTCSLAIDFGFLPDDTGAFDPDAAYEITVEGGGNAIPNLPPVTPPPPAARAYNFVVTQ